MQPKDLLAVLLSALALVVSIVATVIAFWQKSEETVRTSRNQISDAVSKLTAIEIEVDVLSNQIKETQAGPEEQRLRALRHWKNQQRFALARLADFLMAQKKVKKSDVSDIELAALARTFTAARDLTQAEDYWKRAIKACKSKVYIVALKRSYAEYVFKHVESKAGRDRYRDAVGCADSEKDDSVLWEIMYTFLSWARLEASNGDCARAKDLVREAAQSAGRIRNLTLKADGENKIVPTVARELKVEIHELAAHDERRQANAHRVPVWYR